MVKKGSENLSGLVRVGKGQSERRLPETGKFKVHSIVLLTMQTEYEVLFFHFAFGLTMGATKTEDRLASLVMK